MNRLWLLVVGIFLVFLFPVVVMAQSDTGWLIDRFHSNISITEDGGVTIVETLEVDFFDLQKHGIFRTIPTKYKTPYGNTLDVRFTLLNVTDENDTELKVVESRDGDNTVLKIGHPNVFVSGKQTYMISYRVNRVITQPEEQAEFYWNATGNRWPVPMHQISTTVYAPSDSVLDTICFTGYFGSVEKNCQHNTDGTTAHFSTNTVNPGEGMTLSVALDQNKLNLPSSQQKLWWLIQDNWLYATPLLVLIFMIRWYWTRGRDDQYKNIFSESGSQTVPLFGKLDALSVYGPPKNLSPGEVGVLVDEKVHMRDIAAVAIDLARRGFFTIKDKTKKGIFAKTDVELMNNQKSEEDLLSFEVSIMDMLFGKKRSKTAKLKKLHSSAYSSLQEAQKNLYKHLTEQGYFSGNPQTVRVLYVVLGIAIMVIGIMIASSSVGRILGSGGGVFAAIMSGLIVLAFSFFMPARTPKGRKALKTVVGLKEWIRIGAWREQIHEKNNFLEEVLPYTIAFGMTQKFIKAFSESDLKKISWYQSTRPMSVSHFNQSIGSFDSVVSKGVSAGRPASSGGSGFSGGGSSGGGFGGGGGGSW